MKKAPCFAFLLALVLSTNLKAQLVPLRAGEEAFSAVELRQGVVATSKECTAVDMAVWARVSDEQGECIRFWPSGLSASNPVSRVLIYIPGDQMAFDSPNPGYETRSPKFMRDLADSIQAKLGVPFILLSRPGILGSSGEHRKRRRELESRLMSAALDEIKKKYSIVELVLVGWSGGGHVVASLLGWRSDIVCAVPTSSVSSPKVRWQGMGRTTDLTGYADSYEPVDQLKSENFHPKLRVFVIGDIKDSNVVWTSQTPLAQRLKELGASVEVITGEGSDPQHHVLASSGQLIGSLCLQDKSTQEILEVASKGLKG